MSSWKRWQNKSVGLLVLRVAAGIVFLVHGYGKLFGNMPSMAMFTGMVAHMGFPLPALFAWIVALAEFLGGIALILGVFTCFFSAVLAVDMLVAFGAVQGLSINKGGLEFMLLMSMIALMLTGPGSITLKNKLGMNKMKDGKACGCGGNCNCGSSGGTCSTNGGTCACGNGSCGTDEHKH